MRWGVYIITSIADRTDGEAGASVLSFASGDLMDVE